MTEQTNILHIALAADIEQIRNGDDYHCLSLDTEGFIHCCHSNQLAGVVNRYYQGVDNVYLLVLKVDDLGSALILENTAGGSELFPHIYGPIKAAAVVQIIPFGIGSTERMGLEA